MSKAITKEEKEKLLKETKEKQRKRQVQFE